jgi:hypothetical protein
MATKQKLTPILTKVTFWPKDSIVSDKNLFIDSENYKTSSAGRYKDGKFNYIDSLVFLDEGKNKSYFRNLKPIWTIEFIEEIENNKRTDCYGYSDVVENLYESISDYGGDCGVSKIIKDVENLFDKDYANKKGKETRKFITLFFEWSSWDSYAGDGDYGIEYKKVVDIKDLFDDIKIEIEEDFYGFY